MKDDLTKNEWCLISSIKNIEMFVSTFPKVGDKRELLSPYIWQFPPLVDPIACCAFGRDTGKSSIIVGGKLGHALANVSQSLFTTFDEKHLHPPLEICIENFKYNPFLSQFVPWAGNKRGVQRSPEYLLRTFDMFPMGITNELSSNFLYGRIPGPVGTGVLGPHVWRVVVDECQDYPRIAWTNLQKTIEEPDASKGYGITLTGVSNGSLRTPFYDAFHAKNSIFEGHRYNMASFCMPDYSFLTYKNDLTALGGFDGADYQQNVLGLWGSPAESLFSPDLYQQCVDYPKHPYSHGMLNNNYRKFVFTRAHVNSETSWEEEIYFEFKRELDHVLLRNFKGEYEPVLLEDSILSVDVGFSSTTFISGWFKLKGRWWNLFNIMLNGIEEEIYHSRVLHVLHRRLRFGHIMIDVGGGFGQQLIMSLKNYPEFSDVDYEGVLVDWTANKKAFFRYIPDKENGGFKEELATEQAIGIFWAKRDFMEKNLLMPEDMEVFRSITGVKERQDGSGRPESMTKFHGAAALLGFEVCKARDLPKITPEGPQEIHVGIFFDGNMNEFYQ